MTAPSGEQPAGSLAPGLFAERQAMTQNQAIAESTGGRLGGYEGAQQELKAVIDPIKQVVGDLQDGQLELNDRLDLLEAVNGYCALYMGMNWAVAGGHRVTLPFDSQLGPRKGADPFQNGILLASKGLWRADALVSFYPPPANWFSGASSVSIQVYLSVVAATGGATYTEHEYNMVVTSLGAETAAFSHTFVIPADGAYFVRVQVNHPKDSASVYGGTVRSALTANKWDNSAENAVVAPTVPDGGTLS
ncbi:hypothetical protein QT969_10390 [Rhodococcus sp. CSLK01-03]|uniref:Uncharacterized protein n=1 Tax=Rhodococcus indonesiensis TaxID=3055869 RepID=A0ABT7RN39_9NOCA|nr:hypothetical protein [Rhodococcus indonesiensis]MDM7488699.1 hypothetical protein [Rhodococcus indonesiensis]